MRITQSHMMELAADAVSTAQSRVATASAQTASGVRVNVPSDDLVAWEEGERASIRDNESTQRGSAINLGLGKLQAADGALTSVSNALSTARSLANEMANGTLSAAQRQAAAQQVQALHDSVLSALNTTGPDGKPLFSGSQAGLPFATNDSFSGDTTEGSMEIAEGQTETIGVSGQLFTAANGGVDVLGTLTNLVSALNSNNTTAVTQALSDLQTATNQVTSAQSTLGAQESALNNANDARSSFETQLQTLTTNEMGIDTSKAAAALANAQNAYNAATTVATVINQLAQKNIS